jgi:hypothetical protein
MPKRHRKKEPTLWQRAKPHIRDILGAALVEQGFANPGTTMWRHRPDFVDVVHLRSKYGSECTVHFGCNPRFLGKPQPDVWDCIFRTSLHDSFRLPADPSALPAMVISVIQPQVCRVLDTWFSRFASIDVAISLLDNVPTEVSYSNKDSPAWRYAMDALKQYRGEFALGHRLPKNTELQS